MKSYIYNFRKLGTKKHKNEELSAVTSCRNASDETKQEVEVAVQVGRHGLADAAGRRADRLDA